MLHPRRIELRTLIALVRRATHHYACIAVGLMERTYGKEWLQPWVTAPHFN